MDKNKKHPIAEGTKHTEGKPCHAHGDDERISVRKQLAESGEHACCNGVASCAKKSRHGKRAQRWRIDGLCPFCKSHNGKHVIEWSCGFKLALDLGDCSHNTIPVLRRR